MVKKNGESESKPTRTPGRRRTDKTAQAAPASAPDTARTATARVAPASTSDVAGGTTAPAAPASAADAARIKTPGTVSLKGTALSQSPEEVRRRAFELYLQRGAVHGRDLDDWYEAERQLRRGRM